MGRVKWMILFIMCFVPVAASGPLCQGVRSSFRVLNKHYTFPCNASACYWAEWKKVVPSDGTIASYQKQTCTTRQGFRNDFTCEGNHLRLEAAKYTDRGTYMFICDQAEHSVILDVLYAIKVNVTQMDNVTLDCYHADRARDVTWLRNNETVVHYKRDESVSPPEGFEGRASVERSSFNTGRFSLTITAVQQTEAGLYRCFVDDETIKGYPHAYLLHVNEKRSGPESEQSDCSCTGLIIYSTLITVLVCGISLFAIVHYKPWHFISRAAVYQPTSPTSAPEDESDPKIEVKISTLSSTDDHHPVQESDPSRIRPFS